MKKKILLVEYASSTIEIIKEILSHSVFEITVANEGDTAKQYLEQENFDMMITAAMLPKFHGFSLSLFAAQNYPGIKIIITSQIYKGMEYRHQATHQYKADDFIEIPFDKSTLKKRIYELLGIDETTLMDRPEMRTTQIPISDTNKIPTLEKIAEEQKKLTSDDLFGDIIDQVHQIPSYEIELNNDAAPEKTAKPQEPTKAKQTAKTPETVEMSTSPKGPGVTREMAPPVTQVMKQAPGAPPKIKTTNAPSQKSQVPPVTQVMKKTPAAHRAENADLDLLELLKPKAKPANTETGQKPKYKKIEDDISKKFEETLSGLGISKKKTAPKQKGPYSTQKIDLEQLRPKTPAPGKDSAEELVGYEVLGLIGRGGMAEIFKAKKKGVKGFEKVIALKKILSGYGEDAKYIEMFVDEAKIAAQLTHSNIVHIYDLGKKDDYYFIAMEYVRGKDLRLILQRLAQLHIPMPEELAIYLITKVLEALSYAHTARDGSGKRLDIVHRDVSPPNILVSYDGNIKLTDFGVSKASIKMHQTLAGALKGKLLYMSPEQASGKDDIDFRSDLYSVGIILYELLTGQKLFMDSSEILTLQKVQEGKITRPSYHRKDIDPQLEAIVLKSLTKNINKRYQKASEMIRDLDSYMSKNYQNSPEAGHITHFLYTLFKEEIVKDGIDIHLTPIAHPIKKLVKEHKPPVEAAPSPPPEPELAQTPFPETIAEPIDENGNNNNDIFELNDKAKITVQLPPQEMENLQGPPTEQLPPEEMTGGNEIGDSGKKPGKSTEIQEPPPFPEPEMELSGEPFSIEEPSLDTIQETLPETKSDAFPETMHEDVQEVVHEAVQEVKPIEEEEPFQPIIEINFDDDIPETLPPEPNLPKEDTDSLFETPRPSTAAGDVPKQEPVSVPEESPEPITEQEPEHKLEKTPEPATSKAKSYPDPSASKESAPGRQQPEIPVLPEMESLEEEAKGRKRRNLLLAFLGIIVILAVIIIFVLMGGDSSEIDKPAAPPGSTGTESAVTLPQPSSGAESLPAGAGEQTDQGEQANLDRDAQKPAVDPAAPSLKQQKLDAGDTSKTGLKDLELPTEKSSKKKDKSRSKDKQDKKESRDNKDTKDIKDKEKKPAKDKDAAGVEPTAADKEKLIPSSAKPEKKDSQKKKDESGKAELSPQTQPEVKDPTETKTKTETKPVPAQPEISALKEGDVLAPSEVDTQPVVVSKKKIKINRNLRRLLTSDERIFITYLVEHDGTVKTVKLLKKSSIKKINSSIISSVKKWTFKPATKNNVRVKIWKNQWIVIKK